MASTREESPFASLRRQDVERMLASCSTLGVALQQAMQDENSRLVLGDFSWLVCGLANITFVLRFCEDHDSQGAASEIAWRLHAALLNMMLQPLVQTFKRASDAAIEALYPNSTREPELAFRGEARDAYVWLQCMLREELQWCTSICCPSKPCVSSIHVSS